MLVICGERTVAIVGVDQAGPELWVADQLVRPVAEHDFDLWTHVAQPASVRHAIVGDVDVHRSRNVLDQDAVTRIGLRSLAQGDLDGGACLAGVVQQTPALVHEDGLGQAGDRKSTRLNSSHVANSYAVFGLKKKKVVPKGDEEG